EVQNQSLYAVAHPKAIGHFITHKLPIALSCHANSLKSWMGQNVNSPFGNIRAVTFKLYPRSTRIALESSSLQLTLATKDAMRRTKDCIAARLLSCSAALSGHSPEAACGAPKARGFTANAQTEAQCRCRSVQTISIL